MYFLSVNCNEENTKIKKKRPGLAHYPPPPEGVSEKDNLTVKYLQLFITLVPCILPNIFLSHVRRESSVPGLSFHRIIFVASNNCFNFTDCLDCKILREMWKKMSALVLIENGAIKKSRVGFFHPLMQFLKRSGLAEIFAIKFPRMRRRWRR